MASEVRSACERLMEAANGHAGVLVINLESGLTECVLVRRQDLELLIATWSEQKA